MNGMIIIGIIALIVLAMTMIYQMRFSKKKKGFYYQNQEKVVIVKNGVDVKKQILGGEKGEHFTGNLKKADTYLINSAVTNWRIIFDNLDTKERHYIKFVNQMWIGRQEPDQPGGAKLILSQDIQISRNHCTIYEVNERLCLQDLNSKNHTCLNGTMISNAVYLNNEDVLQVGNTRLKVWFEKE